MSRPIPTQTAPFLREGEALRLVAYDDLQPNRRSFASASQIKGRPTIGYGHTTTVTKADVVSRKRIDRPEAERLLDLDIADAARKLAGVVRADVLDDLTGNQYAALLSFVFNLGANKGWTIWKRLNARQFDQVPAQMSRFVYATGNDGKAIKLDGLVKRRADEVRLWSTGEPGSVQLAVSSSVTRSTPTPPAPEPAVKTGKVGSGGLLAGLGGLGGLVAVAQPILQGITTPWALLAFALVALGVFMVLTGRVEIKKALG